MYVISMLYMAELWLSLSLSFIPSYIYVDVVCMELILCKRARGPMVMVRTFVFF